jgi:hypothetical protein
VPSGRRSNVAVGGFHRLRSFDAHRYNGGHHSIDKIFKASWRNKTVGHHSFSGAGLLGGADQSGAGQRGQQAKAENGGENECGLAASATARSGIWGPPSV